MTDCEFYFLEGKYFNKNTIVLVECDNNFLFLLLLFFLFLKEEHWSELSVEELEKIY